MSLKSDPPSRKQVLLASFFHMSTQPERLLFEILLSFLLPNGTLRSSLFVRFVNIRKKEHPKVIMVAPCLSISCHFCQQKGVKWQIEAVTHCVRSVGNGGAFEGFPLVSHMNT